MSDKETTEYVEKDNAGMHTLQDLKKNAPKDEEKIRQKNLRKAAYKQAKERFKNSAKYTELKEKQKKLRREMYQKAKTQKNSQKSYEKGGIIAIESPIILASELRCSDEYENGKSKNKIAKSEQPEKLRILAPPGAAAMPNARENKIESHTIKKAQPTLRLVK